MKRLLLSLIFALTVLTVSATRYNQELYLEAQTTTVEEIDGSQLADSSLVYFEDYGMMVFFSDGSKQYLPFENVKVNGSMVKVDFQVFNLEDWISMDWNRDEKYFILYDKIGCCTKKYYYAIRNQL